MQSAKSISKSTAFLSLLSVTSQGRSTLRHTHRADTLITVVLPLHYNTYLCSTEHTSLHCHCTTTHYHTLPPNYHTLPPNYHTLSPNYHTLCSSSIYCSVPASRTSRPTPSNDLKGHLWRVCACLIWSADRGELRNVAVVEWRNLNHMIAAETDPGSQNTFRVLSHGNSAGPKGHCHCKTAKITASFLRSCMHAIVLANQSGPQTDSLHHFLYSKVPSFLCAKDWQ